MINLGFNSGRKMPNVYLELSPIDRIIEGLSVLFVAAAWVLAIVFYYDLPSPPARLFISPGSMTVMTLLFLWLSRAPIRFYNFPVKLNERNYVMQYLLASRLTRTMSLIMNLLLFWGLFIEVEYFWGVPTGTFSILMTISGGLMIVSLVVYYIFAFRNR